VFFYFGRTYELSLFLQTLVMIVIQLVLLKFALDYRPRQWTEGPLDKDPNLVRSTTNQSAVAILQFLIGYEKTDNNTSSSRPYSFWDWKEQKPYWNFLIRLCLWLTIFQVMFGNWPVYVESLGLIGLLIEAILPIPQILTIASRGSVDGFRVTLLVSWLGGDISKLIYLTMRDSKNIAPQFIFCALVQGIFDLFIGLQYYMYTTGKWAGTKEASVRLSRQRAQSLKMQGVGMTKVQ
jgi:hypothetical protein